MFVKKEEIGLDNSLNIARLTLIILLGIYEYWTFKNKKSIIKKLIPIILGLIIALIALALVLFLGIPAIFFIFVVLLMELSLLGTISIVLVEAILATFGDKRNLRKTLILYPVLIFLIVVYYLGEKVF